MEYVTVRVLNLSSILSSNGCNPALCIATPEVKLQPEDGPHAGPKHVVVSPMY